MDVHTWVCWNKLVTKQIPEWRAKCGIINRFPEIKIFLMQEVQTLGGLLTVPRNRFVDSIVFEHYEPQSLGYTYALDS